MACQDKLSAVSGQLSAFSFHASPLLLRGRAQLQAFAARPRYDRGNSRIKRVTRAICLLTAPMKNINTRCVYFPSGHRSEALMSPLRLPTLRPSILPAIVLLCFSLDQSARILQRGSLLCRKRQKPYSSEHLLLFGWSFLFWWHSPWLCTCPVAAGVGAITYRLRRRPSHRFRSPAIPPRCRPAKPRNARRRLLEPGAIVLRSRGRRLPERSTRPASSLLLQPQDR